MIPNHMIGVSNGFEERESIREVTMWRDGAKLDELAKSEVGVVEASFDDLGVDLFESLEGFAVGKES
jgi:hypothetical protein